MEKILWRRIWNPTQLPHWNLVERPLDINIVGSQWTFRVKRNNLRQVDKYKAQLVAQGFSQVSSLDFNKTFSPTIRFTSIHFILAMACHYNLELWHVDIKGAEEFTLGVDPKSLQAMVLMQTVYNAVVQHSGGFLKHVVISVTEKGRITVVA